MNYQEYEDANKEHGYDASSNDHGVEVCLLLFLLRGSSPSGHCRALGDQWLLLLIHLNWLLGPSPGRRSLYLTDGGRPALHSVISVFSFSPLALLADLGQLPLLLDHELPIPLLLHFVDVGDQLLCRLVVSRTHAVLSSCSQDRRS